MLASAKRKKTARMLETQEEEVARGKEELEKARAALRETKKSLQLEREEVEEGMEKLKKVRV